MKLITTFFLLLLVGLLAQQSTAQVLYSEDFDNNNATIPANLTIIDGDVAPANTNTAAFDSWTLTLNPYNGNDTIMAVTSWLDPVGVANDWLITPQVAGINTTTTLSWEAMAFNFNFADGYEVWVTSTIAGAAPVITDFTTGGTVVFAIAAEDTLFTPHTVSLAAFAGQSIYVAFRNNSNDKVLLGLDDIVIENSIALAATYTTIPASCNGANGSISLTTTGGQAPYTYQWDAAAASQTTATASNLMAGTYGITVTDATGAVITASLPLTGVNTTNLYFEDFEGASNVMPTNITVIDVDAAPANSNIPAAFDQWIVAESNWIAGSTDNVAAVTSWLEPCWNF